MKRILLLALGLLVGNTYLIAQEVLRTPSLSPSAKDLVFSYQGDIWNMNMVSGQLKRMTIHEAYESNPVFSADGSKIAFSANRFGNNDIFVMPLTGGAPERLTHHSSNDVPSGWSANGKIFFSTNRMFSQVEWDGEIFTINERGGTPQRFLNAVGDQATPSPDGKYLAYVRGACRMAREAYRGPADTEIWLYNIETKEHRQITKNEGNDVLPKWTDNEHLAYISSTSNKTYNLVKQAITEGSTPVVITDFSTNGVLHFDYANSTYVIQRLGGLYLKKGDKGSVDKINMALLTDYRFDPIEKKTYSNAIRDYAIAPGGKSVAMIIRGEVFVKAVDKEKSQATNLSNHPYRELEVEWANDSVLLFTSDRDGTFNLYSVSSADEKKPLLEQSLKHTIKQRTSGKLDITGVKVSPDGKKLVYLQDGKALMVAEVSAEGALSNKRELLNNWDGAGGLAWSPDSRYLAYSQSDLNFNNEVFIMPIDGSRESVNVSMHPRGDYRPFWSKDGSKLGFVSSRNNGDNDVWFVWLTREDWLKTQEDREEGYYFEEDEEEEKEDDDEEDKDKDETENIIIDFEDIHDRLQQVTSMPGNEGNLLISKDGETFYFTARSLVSEGSSDLYSIKWDGTEINQLTKGGQGPYSLKLDPAGDDLFALKRGKLNKIDHGKGKATPYPHSAKMLVNLPEERKQIFDEAWKNINESFYDPDFHGKDWNKLRDQYRPYALTASTNQDFRYVFNLMLGQLNASHMGLYGPNQEKTQRESTGRLGIEIEPLKKGVKVTNVLANGPADREKSQLMVGDIITSVGGVEVTDKINFYSLLSNQTENKVLMSVKGKDGEREIVIRPTRSIRTELYEDWVKQRQKLVEKYSNGRLGYIHIRGMDKPSFERFERELQASGFGKEGIVIDVRFNGGGWTTDYLMAVLNVKQHAYTIPRGAAADLNKEQKNFRPYYPYSERLPLSSWVKPSIAMCNESSYSNAEIFSHAYKTLDIGTLVGMPTFGAVISTGGSGLLDGSFVRIPFRGWYVKATDQNMENGPAVPDILVENQPDSKTKGRDEQLKKAVDTLLQQLDDQ
jgi:tricorn protease